jgi:hypothetical protein
VGLGAARGIRTPVLGQIQPARDWPGNRPLGVVTVDTELAVGGLANRAGLLARHPDRRSSLVEKAGVIKDQHRIALDRQFQHLFDSLLIEGLGIPLHQRWQPLELLVVGAGDDGGERIAVLVQ